MSTLQHESNTHHGVLAITAAAYVYTKKHGRQQHQHELHHLSSTHLFTEFASPIATVCQYHQHIAKAPSPS
jgi:hypothetical protein